MMMMQLSNNGMNWAADVGAYRELDAKIRRIGWWLMLSKNLDDSDQSEAGREDGFLMIFLRMIDDDDAVVR